MTVTVRAPGRVNLIGDHVDYMGGRVFPIAIDRWTEITGVPHNRIRLTSTDEAMPVDLPVVDDADPQTSSPRWGRYVAAVAAEIGRASGFAGSVTSSIPIGAGLSSSASFEIAVALALGFEGSAIELAELGQRAEHRATGVPTGIMDQLCIAAAKEGHGALIDCERLQIEHVPLPSDVEIVVRYVAHRTLEGSGYADRVEQCRAAEAVVGPLRLSNLGELGRIDDETVRRRARHVITEIQRVDDFVAALMHGDYRGAGEIMVASHRSLRDDFEVSTPELDAAIADLVRRPAVYGARMTGGGFGGCVVALCRPDADIDGWTVRPVGGAHRSDGTT
jgi:galactokinase